MTTAAFDIAILGAGPAGMAAAAVAARAGALVALLDSRDIQDGPARGAPAGASPRLFGGCDVWSIGGGRLVAANMPDAPFRLDAVRDGAGFSLTARALVLCTGATERIIPFPGWRLPGIAGLADASPRGRRVVLAGGGAMLCEAARRIRQAGGRIAAIVDRAPSPRLPAALRRAGITLLSCHHVTRAFGTGRLAAIEVARPGGGRRRRITCDALHICDALVPATEAARLLRADIVYDRRGFWLPVLDRALRCSVKLLYAAGGAAGFTGPNAARLSGERAALAALADLGLAGDTARSPHDIDIRLARARAAASAPPRPSRARRIAPHCVICPCEGITRRQIDAAIGFGARDVNQVKHFTRCGMGTCQGRICGETVCELVAARVGGRARAGIFTARIPLRPVPMATLLGRFDYADIPIPAPAPI